MKEIRRNLLGMTIFAIYSLVAFTIIFLLFARGNYIKDFPIITVFRTSGFMTMGFVIGYGFRTMVLLKKFQENCKE